MPEHGAGEVEPREDETPQQKAAAERRAKRLEEERKADMLLGLAAEKRMVVSYVDAYYWRCQVCGWLGTGLPNALSAKQEGARHFREMHPDMASVNLVRKDMDRHA